jgi:ethanolamine permease
MEDFKEHFSRSLGPISLWGLGVGYVISGMYFGWNLGLPAGGTFGLGIAILFISIMYIAFTFSYCELASAIPKAGGAFAYASLALGPYWGFLTGIAQLIEFVFAPPAIAAAIGAYCEFFLPVINPLFIAITAYFIFTAINIYGVKAAASFELVITIIAVLELLIFAGSTLPHFHYQNLFIHSLPNGVTGIFVAIPFAIWFFLGIEGVANMAEETKNPQRNIVIGFGSAMFTIVILCFLTFFGAIGVGGSEKIVFSAHSSIPSNSPLPLALGQIVNQSHILFKMLLSVALIGLIASFHGLILAGGRCTYELGRMGYAPKLFGKIHQEFKTPAAALIINMTIGIFALKTGKTSDIITLSCFGALTLYIFSMISLIQLRKLKPDMKRPFRAPFYPYSPFIALIIAGGALIVMSIYNLKCAAIYFALLASSLLWFHYLVINKERMEALTAEVNT